MSTANYWKQQADKVIHEQEIVPYIGDKTHIIGQDSKPTVIQGTVIQPDPNPTPVQTNYSSAILDSLIIISIIVAIALAFKIGKLSKG